MDFCVICKTQVFYRLRYIFHFLSPCNFFWGLSLALRSHDQILASHWSTPHSLPDSPPHPVFFVFSFFYKFILLLIRWSGEGGGEGLGGGKGGRRQKKAIRPFFHASGNKNIGASIRIGWEILCLPCAGFFLSKCTPFTSFFPYFPLQEI